ncbi:hypothetical protein B0H19DRAFT_1072199 [Mycena capillaripes]|nr:hypothetical protein B0H19DRAFT_1072199 [Mycena capillaripes]
MPLLNISNTLSAKSSALRTLESRLPAIENDLTEIQNKLGLQRNHKRHKRCFSDFFPSTPLPKRPRIMRNLWLGGPVDRLQEARIHRSSLMASTPEREEMGHCLHEGDVRVAADNPALTRDPCTNQNLRRYLPGWNPTQESLLLSSSWAAARLLFHRFK